MSRFPFPMPYGWFMTALADDLPPDEVVTRKAFGTDVVLWRDAEGRPVCQEAYCPHLGAHLGVGGTVRDDGCIQCPFHGWAYGADGRNVEVPYADAPNRGAALRTYPTREHAGVILTWYHPQGVDPLWEPLDVPEHEDPDFAPYEVHRFTIGSCLQEIGENGFDHAHFQFVHSHPKVGDTESVVFDGYDRTVLTKQKFPSSRGPVDARIDVYGRGPGFAITRYRGLIDATLVGCTTPIDDETTEVTFLFALRNPDADEHTANIARAFVKSVVSEVQQDIPIWENKRYLATPKLAPSEQAIGRYRAWFQQFYVTA